MAYGSRKKVTVWIFSNNMTLVTLKITLGRNLSKGIGGQRKSSLKLKTKLNFVG